MDSIVVPHVSPMVVANIVVSSTLATSLTLDFVVLVFGVDFAAISIIPSTPLVPFVVATSLSLDFAILVSSMDSTVVYVISPTLGILMVGSPLAPPMVVVGPYLDSTISFSSVSKVAPPVVHFLGCCYSISGFYYHFLFCNLFPSFEGFGI